MPKANKKRKNVGKIIKNIIVGKTIFQFFFRVYLFTILIGALILYSGCTHSEWTIRNTITAGTHPYTFWNALFIACSAFSNTGLTCFNIDSFYNFWGEFIIFLLIWLGGMGIISLFYVIWNAFKDPKDVKFNQIILLQSERGTTKLGNTFKAIRFSVLFVMCVQVFFGFIYAFWLCWMPIHTQGSVDHGYSAQITYDIPGEFVESYHNFTRAFWQGMFTSFSATNNAGFDLFEQNFSLAALRNDWNVVFLFFVTLEIIVGGIGYPLIYDIYTKIKLKRLNLKHKLTLFSKVCLVSYFAILGIGLICSYGFEFGAVNTSDLPSKISFVSICNDETHKYWGNCETFNKCFAVFFNTVSTRSAGLSTIDQRLFTLGSKSIYIVMMFIGGSPSSAAGGIRTTTFVILLATIFATARGKTNTSLFKRTIPKDTVIRSYLVFGFGLATILLTALIVLYSPTVETPGIRVCEIPQFTYTACLYEVASAFGTVGYTMGITAIASPVILIFFIFCMFVGQLGVSNTILLWVRKTSLNREINYIEEDIRIG